MARLSTTTALRALPYLVVGIFLLGLAVLYVFLMSNAKAVLEMAQQLGVQELFESVWGVCIISYVGGLCFLKGASEIGTS